MSAETDAKDRRNCEECLALAPEAAETGPWVLDEQAARFRVGPKIMELFGLPPGDTLGVERFFEMIHPDDREDVRAAMADALRSREMKAVEYRIVRPDGQIRWMLSRGRLCDREGGARLMGVTADITPHKQREASLAQVCRHNELILQSVAEGIIGLDLQGNHVFVNPSAAKMLGHAPGELVGRSAHDLWHHSTPDGKPYAESDCPICAILRGGSEARVTDEVFWRKDGTSFPVEYTCTPISEDGRRVGTVIAFMDVTERARREEELRSSQVRIRSAIEIAGVGFYEMDASGRVAFQDERIKALAGFPPGEEAKGHDFWWAHIHPDDVGALLKVTPQVLEEGPDRLMLEYRYLHPTLGPRWFHHLVHVQARDANGRAVRIIGVLRDITERKNAENELRAALDEVRRLRDRLQNENVYLREQMRSESGHGAIVGESEPVQKMLAMARKVAPTDSAVLITGETGTGKELLAQAIHDMSPRKGKTMVKVNCAALPAPLIESELFGREKGAYTGAMTQQVGRFEVADGSTIFLDEIGDLPLDLQVKLLRVLQDGSFERLGSHRTLSTDVRVIAATNRDLAAMIGEGKFREDLFHRLNVFPIEVPPLRARSVDIPLLVWKFVQEFNLKMGRAVDSIPKPSMERLKQHPWPGNVRELRNVIERAMIVSEGHSLRIDLPSAVAPPSSTPSTLEDVERRHILDVLERTHWRISGKGGAAETLGLIPTTLHSRMKKLGITRPVR